MVSFRNFNFPDILGPGFPQVRQNLRRKAKVLRSKKLLSHVDLPSTDVAKSEVVRSRRNGTMGREFVLHAADLGSFQTPCMILSLFLAL